ncbi:helix-turn-helix transcriptional regulator [Micromonospora sp. NPDC049559]|uniref:helix-turn-helix transcriptional regulator n=1 Tax=Micromonospora sp. NPDC049559 TaxID=3155923 RepID=UPI003444DD40
MVTRRQAHRAVLGMLRDITGVRPPPAEMFRQCTDLLRESVGFDAVCWHLNDPVTGLIGTVQADGLDPRGFAQAVAMEYGADDVATFVKIRQSGQPADALSQATQGRVDRSIRYRQQLASAGFGDELRANFDARGGRWGCAAFMRAPDRGFYTPHQLRLARQVARELGAALRDLHRPRGERGPYADHLPATAVLGARNELLAADPAAQAIIDELTEDEPGLAVPACFVVVATEARRAYADRVTRPAKARVRDRGGAWLVVHASLLDGRADGRVAVVVTAASPVEVLPVVLTGYGLSGREQEVALAVVRGGSTSEIARALSLTNLTVQDHLKSIFQKTGVRSRRELIARLLAMAPPEIW